jgi:molybdopterin-guanine dinucleotide biosynthesis protein A
MRVPLYILAGGRSSRFGSDKASADLAGKPMIARLADQWSPWASQIVTIADCAGKYHSLGFTTIADLQPALGPIGGLLTAATCAPPGWFLLAACDAFILDASFPQRLFSGLSGQPQVVAARADFWEPLPALYHSSLLPIVQACIAENLLALWKLIEKVPHALIPYPAGSRPILHVNTRGDLEQLQTLTCF